MLSQIQASVRECIKTIDLPSVPNVTLSSENQSNLCSWIDWIPMKIPDRIFLVVCIRCSAQSGIDLEWKVTRYFSCVFCKSAEFEPLLQVVLSSVKHRIKEMILKK